MHVSLRFHISKKMKVKYNYVFYMLIYITFPSLYTHNVDTATASMYFIKISEVDLSDVLTGIRQILQCITPFLTYKVN